MAKRAVNKPLEPWISSLVYHIYWVAASSDGNRELMEAKWRAAAKHVVNVHTHESSLFPACQHEELDGDRVWLDEGMN